MQQFTKMTCRDSQTGEVFPGNGPNRFKGGYWYQFAPDNRDLFKLIAEPRHESRIRAQTAKIYGKQSKAQEECARVQGRRFNTSCGQCSDD
jgi:hypothetical protein